MKGQGGISCAGWRWIETAAGLLAPADREVVLGDLSETYRGVWCGLGDVLGLAVRRQLALWRSWQPWAASLGLALPASLFLMGWSVQASGSVARLLGEPQQAHLFWLSVSTLFLVSLWAWTTGFVVGAISQRTLWASMLGCCGPCLYCLSEWPGHGLSGLRLLIFLLPGLWGAWRGRKDPRLGLGWAIFLAAVTTLALPIWGKGGWIHSCWLLWPGWYLAATARRKQE